MLGHLSLILVRTPTTLDSVTFGPFFPLFRHNLELPQAILINVEYPIPKSPLPKTQISQITGVPPPPPPPSLPIYNNLFPMRNHRFLILIQQTNKNFLLLFLSKVKCQDIIKRQSFKKTFYHYHY